MVYSRGGRPTHVLFIEARRWSGKIPIVFGGLPFSLPPFLSAGWASWIVILAVRATDSVPFTHSTSPPPSSLSFSTRSIDRPSSQFVLESTALVLRIHQSAYTIRSVRPPTHQHPRTSLSRPSCRFWDRWALSEEDLLFRLRKLLLSPLLDPCSIKPPHIFFS